MTIEFLDLRPDAIVLGFWGEVVGFEEDAVVYKPVRIGEGCDVQSVWNEISDRIERAREEVLGLSELAVPAVGADRLDWGGHRR